ncbi:MAG: hypothetical protein AVDCRST_MAG22-1555 [uncultured Rubrobacteraceae bacterium]|uniref:Uncharacterized protein n=1 Tax=uncultured Rubrobacteraceae bacterium TaxID=349277 RepID=A0A6J4P6J4_9ACTN|nr:MAG: hypothetical protein AVDCRST_MAG22-1555 [uncultured Rubrobacteraceae bacterium]
MRENLVLSRVPENRRSSLPMRLFGSFLNDPEFPPGTPRYSVYLMLVLISVGTLIFVVSSSSIRYGGIPVLSINGVALLIRGVAEFLPVRWRMVCISLRFMGLLTAIIALWLLVVRA